MNNKFFKLGALLVVLMLFAAFNTFAQLSTVYVDVTNGSDTYSGANATNNPFGTGPVATINKGLTLVANNGTLVVMGGSYNGGNNAGGDVNINSTTYTNLAASGSLTIELRQLLSNNNVLMSAGNFIYNVAGGTLNIVTTNGTEYFTLGAGAATLTLGGGSNSSTMNIGTASFFQLPSGSSIVMNGASAFSNQAPQKGANISLTYQGGSSVTAGPESNYSTYGTGSIAVNKTAGTTVTMPNAITTVAGITVASGNATFSNNVTMGAFDVSNAGTGTVTFNSPVAFSIKDGTTNTDLGSVVNTSTGTITFNGTATWTAAALATTSQTFAAAAGTFVVDNQSTGSILFNQPITLTNAATTVALYNVTFTANNAAAGTLTLGTVGAATGGTKSTYVILNAQNTAAGGTLNIAGGTIRGFLTNSNGTATTNLTGATTVSGVITNTGTIAIGGNTLTLNAAVTHATNGGTISATSGGGVVVSAGATIDGGTFPTVSVTNTTGTVTFSANTPIVAALNVSGQMAISDGVTFTSNGTVTQTGNLTLGGGASGILAIKGDFNRTSGTWLANAGSELKFTGTTVQSVNSGPNFQVGKLTFTNTGGIITLGASIRASGLVTISSGTTVALNTLNIILNSGTASMTNSGTYTAAGGGGVVIGGSLTVVSGYTGNGITIGGAGDYSFITVDVGSGNTAGLSSSVKFTGILTLRSGQLVTGANDLSPKGTAASVVRWVQSSLPINTAGGTFDAAAVDYDLTYTETLTGTASVAAGASEFDADNVRNLTVSTTAFVLTLTSGSAVTVKGDMNLGTNALFDFDGVTPFSVTAKGTLTVNSGAILGTGSAANTFTLDGDAKVHSVLGTISAGHILTITGTGSALNGSTTTAHAATINNIAFEPTATGATFSSTNLKQITAGPVTVNGTSAATGAQVTIVMNPTSASLVGNIAIGAAAAPTVAVTINGSTTSVHTGNITVTDGALTYTRGGNSTTMTGTVTLTAGSLTLGSNVTVTGTTSQAAANIVLGSFNYTSQGDYTHSGAGTITGSGKFVIAQTAGAGNFTLTSALTVPNLELKASAKTNVVTLVTNNLTVSGVLTLTMGTLDFNALAVTVTGGTVTTAVAAAGDVVFAATGGGTLNFGNGTSGDVTWTSNDDVTMPAATTVVLNSTGTVTWMSDKETASTPVKRTFNLVNFTYTAALSFVTGINDVKITGAFDRSSANAGTWSQGSGYLFFNTATAFKQGAGFSIDNLEITTAATANPLTTGFTVVKNLRLVAGALTINAGLLTLGDGAVVERQDDAAVLSSVPTFAGTVSVKYSTGAGGITTVANFRELPSSVVNFDVLTPQAVTLPKNVTVTGTLTLSGVLTTVVTTKNITMADNATLVLKAAGGTVLPGTNLVLAGALNIVYDGTFTVSTRELGTVTSGVYTKVTGNVEFKSGVTTIDNAITIGGIAKFSGGALEMNGKAVTIQGDVNQTSATGFFQNAGAAANLTFGGATSTALTLKQTWVLPAAGVIKFTLNKTSASSLVTLSGGNLDFATNSAMLYFVNGVLVSGSNIVILKQSSAGGQPVQGFDRTGVTGTNKSHVFGQVRKLVVNTATVDISRVEFPVGTQNPNYRPFAIYFKNAPQASVNITVSHASVRPGGSNGFPIRDGGLVITNYPDFYWYVKSDISLAPSYLFDMEAQAEGYADYATDGIQNLRFVRRDSGLVTNQWVMQKNNNTGAVLYDNSTIALNWPAVKVVDATGGITLQGSIFTYSQINKAPTFSVAPGNLTKNEGDTLSATFTAFDPDLGDLSVMTAVTLPTGATFNATTGVVTWTIPYDLATKTTPTATRTITIRATDTYGPLSRDTTVTITINNVNRKPDFAATGAAKLEATTIKDGQALSFNYVAVDIDADAVTYVGVGLPTGATVSAAGVLAWTPTFAQAALTYTITVVASDGLLTDTTSAVVTVNRSVALGDVDKNGTVQAADASIVLQHVAGLTTITDAAALYAADASKNGTISAFDAALILQAAAGLITLDADADVTLAKTEAAAGVLGWSSPEATKEADVVRVPLNISNSANVYAVQLSSKVDVNAFSIDGVKSSLPEGWEMQWNVVNNELRVAMAGATPLPSGSVAAIMVRMKSRESRLNFSADAMLNEASQSIGAVEIAAVPTEFALAQNYPNPFNPSTTIKYQIANEGNVSLDVWNLQGQKIRTLIAKEQKAGYYSVVWDGRNEAGQTVSSGLYLYRVQAGSFVATHKMLMIK